MYRNKKSGLSILGIIMLVFIAILVLSYFGINIRSVVESEDGQDNINYVTDESKTIWQKYLKEPAEYLWNDVFVGLLWSAFINNLERVKDGLPTEIEEASPKLPASLRFERVFV